MLVARTTIAMDSARLLVCSASWFWGWWDYNRWRWAAVRGGNKGGRGRGARPSKIFEKVFLLNLTPWELEEKHSPAPAKFLLNSTPPACPCKIFSELNAIPSRKKEREMKLFGKRLAPFVKYMELRA
jgi:hypothetical protein